MNITVSGTEPLIYQWSFNGADIPGATGPSLVLPNVQATDQGNYVVTVSNLAGSDTSAAASLTVNVPVQITQHPQSQTAVAGQSVALSVTAQGTASLSYQWKFNGVDIAGATSATLTFGSVQPENAGAYRVIVSNVAGPEASAEATLTVNVPVTITRQPQSLVLSAGSPAVFTVAAAGTAPLSYQWQVNGAGIAGATNDTLTLGSVAPGNAGDYVVVVSNVVGPERSSDAQLAVLLPPAITPLPSAVVVPVGTNVTFTVTVSGQSPFFYQWLLNGANIPGASNDSLTLTNVQPADSGNYSVIVANAGGAVASNPINLLVETPVLAFADNVANTVTKELAEPTFSGGILSAPAVGADPGHSRGGRAHKSIWFAWRPPANGVVIYNTQGSGFDTVVAVYTCNRGAGLKLVASSDDAPVVTTSFLLFNAVAGTVYRIAIDGFEGAAGHIVVSWKLELTQQFLPEILVQPFSQIVLRGADVTFSVVADSREALSYEWYRDGPKLQGAGTTSSNLVVRNVQNPDVGTYTVRVSNGCVSDTTAFFTVESDPAVLQITTERSLVGTGAFTQDKPLKSRQGQVRQSSFPIVHALSPSVARGYSGAQIFSTLSAVKDAGEPSHGGVIGGASVWYSYDAPTNGVLKISTEGSTFDTVMAVYSGLATDFESLVLQAFDNNSGADGRTSVAVLPVVAGTSLFVVVDGVNGARGVVQLNYDLALAPVIAQLKTEAIGASLMRQSVSSLGVEVLVPSSVMVDQNVRLVVVATNQLASVPLTYRWKFNGFDIPGATNAALELRQVTQANSGDYTVTVGNFAGSVVSAPLKLIVNVPVSVTSAPQSLALAAGGAAAFRVTASGTEPLLYQWRFKGNVLAAATNAALFLNNVTLANEGTYSVEIRNAVSSATNAATLTVLEPARIIQQPQVQTVSAGGTVTLSVVAGGTGPLSYQWQFIGVTIPGATSSTFPIINVQPSAAGDYTVVVSNRVQSAISAAARLTVNVPAAILSPPQSQAVLTGNTATFGVTAGGTGPFQYQWRFNGADIAGATGPTLVLPNVQPAQAGNYQVAVSNAAGTASSAEAVLTVIVPPAITQQPQAQTVAAGTDVTLTVAASGTVPLRHQWRFNGVDLAGATGAALLLPAVTTRKAGDYAVLVSNEAGSQLSATAALAVSVPVTITQPPLSQTVVVGSAVNFAVAASGTTPLRYQWRFNGTNDLPGATNASLVLTNVQVAQAGRYQVEVGNAVGAVSSADAVLAVTVPPAITQQPQSQTVSAGADVTLTVAASGTAPLGYQWRLAGVELPGATDATLLLRNVTAADAGDYTVLASNAAGVILSAAATVGVNVSVGVARQPESQTVVVGSTASFAVVANGTAPLRYQWRFNTTNDLSGATNAALVLTNVQPAQAGRYSVAVSNPAGSAGSAEAVLAVQVPPAISQQPQSQTIAGGSDATLSVVATGTAPLGYQWRFNGVDLAGATNATLVLRNVTAGQAGSYTVLISNEAGVAQSASATVGVNVSPSIAQHPQDRTALAGADAAFSVVVGGTGPLVFAWRFNGTNILAGATSSTLVFTNVQPIQAGRYSVEVSNSAGAVRSAEAALTVHVPPQITLEPLSQTVLTGSNVTFTVAATGTAPLRYQWRYNGVEMAGATNATLLLTNVPVGRAGRYLVVVSNVAGAVSSQEAGLIVTSAANLRIISATVLINGFFSLSLTGPLGQEIGLEASGDLVNWDVLTNLTIFKDPRSCGRRIGYRQTRFYRLVVPRASGQIYFRDAPDRWPNEASRPWANGAIM